MRAITSEGPVAHPSRTPGKNVFENVPTWTTVSGGERPEAREAVVRESKLPVGDVLHEEQAAPPSKFDEGLPSFSGQAHPRGVLVVRDDVQELRMRAGREQPLELRHVEASGVNRPPSDVRLETAEGHDGPEVGRGLHERRVAPLEEDLAQQLQGFDPPARDEQFIFARPAPLEPVQPLGQEVAEPRQARGRRVLEGRGIARPEEGGEEVREHGAWERGRVREPTGEGDDAGCGGERQDRHEPPTDVSFGPGGEEVVPSPPALRDPHASSGLIRVPGMCNVASVYG